MKIILTRDVAKLGRRFDIKEVSDGYALNMLIPKGIAIPATAQAVKRVQEDKARMEGERKVQEELLTKNIKSIETITLNMKGKANEKGHLFASIHNEEIVKALDFQAHVQIDPSFIEHEHPLKEIGEHIITIKAGGKSAKLKVVVSAL